jgi:hypothetical protein
MTSGKGDKTPSELIIEFDSRRRLWDFREPFCIHIVLLTPATVLEFSESELLSSSDRISQGDFHRPEPLRLSESDRP